MAKSNVDPAIKAAAIADLIAGEQPAVVAARYGLSAAQVRVWKQRHVVPRPSESHDSDHDSDHDTPDDSPIIRPNVAIRPANQRKQQQFGELVFDLLTAKLEASLAIAKAAQNQHWLVEQTAADLATLGAWLDQSALALGDRLAGTQADDEHSDGDTTE